MEIFPGLYAYFSDKLVTSLLGRGATCNCYAIDADHELWLIDPPGNNRGMMKRFLKALKKDNLLIERLSKVFLTHAHPDHMAGLSYLYNKYSPEIFVHPNDCEVAKGGYPSFWAAQSEAAMDLTPDFYFVPFHIIKYVSELIMGKNYPIPKVWPILKNLSIPFNDMSFKVIHTPGHSPGHVSFYIPERKCLIAGDIFGLFGDHKPVLNLPYCNLDQYQESLKKLQNLDVSLLLTGHKRQLYSDSNFYKKLVEGTLKNCQFAYNITLDIVKKKPGIRIPEFSQKFPTNIWPKVEHRTLAFAALKSLINQNFVQMKNGAFYPI